jgi:nucleoside-diphosphate-sugar epimerase
LHSYLRRSHEVIGWDKKEDLFTLDAATLARENIELLINLSVVADRQSATFQVGAPTDEVNVGGARYLAKILKGSEITWVQMSTREVLGPIYRPRDVRRTAAGYRPKFLVGEEAPYAPQNFYGKSKIVAEFISESHPRSVIVRLTTCYTDFDHPAGNWVVSLIRSAVRGQPVGLTQGGLQFRDPLHSDDLARLLLELHCKKVFGERIHAGGGARNLISLKEFVRRANPDVKIERRPGGDVGFAFDIRKATRLTGWKPLVLVGDKIPVLAENIRRGITGP